MKNYEDMLKKYRDHDIDINSDDAKLYRYEKGDGSFDYELYKAAQTNVNLRKVHSAAGTGPDQWKIKLISKHIKKNIPDLKFGLCHGTRQGSEQKDFNEFLGINVIGTEISHTAADFPNTIQWDFHNAKDEWKENVCFIFSNSFDHSYDPIACLQTWMSCVKSGGKIYLQRGPDDRPRAGTLKQNFGDSSIGIDNINQIPADIFRSKDEVFSRIVDIAGLGKWQIAKPKELMFKIDKRIIVLERR